MSQKDWDAAVAAAKLAVTTGQVVLDAATVVEIADQLDKLRAPVADERAAFAAIAKRRAAEIAAMNIADGHGRFLNAQGHQQAISALDFCVAQFSALPGSLAGGNWRDEFSRRVYEDLAAADNQDVPLEEYPARILGVLDALASAPVAEPETMEEIHRQERERSPWKLPKDPTLPDCAPIADESPMAKMADALREKARQEQQAYQDRRNQATEWGPIPEGTEADRPIPIAPVAHVAGDETSRYLEWAKDRSAWEMPVGTPVYYAALASAPSAGQQPIVHQHGFAADNQRLRAINESLDKQLEEVMTERDNREDVIDKLLDIVLGADRSEWSSEYGYGHAVIEVEERMHALASAPVAGEAQEPVAVVRDNPEDYGTVIDALVALPVGTQLFAAPQPSSVAGEAQEHYDEVKATLQGAHRIMESLSAIERHVGPVGSHARGYTHKITAALRHLDALCRAPRPS